MKDNIKDAINDQIQAEFNSAYVYLAMSAYAEDQGWPGTASWLRAQAQEEEQHAMKFYNFMIERDEKVELQALPKPETEFGNLQDIFDKSLEHEQMITEKINKLYKMAKEEDDYAFESFLKWFLDEQVEEEDMIRDILDKFELADGDKSTLYMIDQELGQRQDGGQQGQSE
ncbi:MAG: ferritin [Candidatus Magasanikbacteria bacterium]